MHPVFSQRKGYIWQMAKGNSQVCHFRGKVNATSGSYITSFAVLLEQIPYHWDLIHPITESGV